MQAAHSSGHDAPERWSRIARAPPAGLPTTSCFATLNKELAGEPDSNRDTTVVSCGQGWLKARNPWKPNGSPLTGPITTRQWHAGEAAHPRRRVYLDGLQRSGSLLGRRPVAEPAMLSKRRAYVRFGSETSSAIRVSRLPPCSSNRLLGASTRFLPLAPLRARRGRRCGCDGLSERAGPFPGTPGRAVATLGRRLGARCRVERVGQRVGGPGSWTKNGVNVLPKLSRPS